MIKKDEQWFFNLVKKRVGVAGGIGRLTDAREIINTPKFPIHYKRAWYLLEKWTCRGWYEYGVTLDLGWMTPEGMKHEM